MDGRHVRHFSKEDIQVANRHMTRCTTSLIQQRNAHQTTIKHYLSSVRMAITRKITNNKCWQGCGNKRVLARKGNVNQCSHYGKLSQGFPDSSVKNPSAMQENLVQFLGQEDPLQKGQATHSSILGLPLWLSR